MSSVNESGGKFARARGWRATIAAATIGGLLVVMLYAAGQADRRLPAASVGLLVGGAGLIVGSLIGFLFGIPRSLQTDRPAQPQAPDITRREELARYGANTNLEQISDWLTKILVGVGLTQLTKLPELLSSASQYVGRALANVQPAGEPPASATGLAYAALIYFPTCGFLFTYLWSRIYLAGALAQADLASQVARVEEKIDAQAKQAETDALALARIARQLRLDPSSPTIPEPELSESIRQASPMVKAQAFYQAQRVRSDNWRDDKALMERTIPIFKALVSSDPEGRFHQNYGQLGFALKDQLNPQWADAEKALTTAIRIRDRVGEGEWWHIYEFNRAVCRIMQDPGFLAKTASSADLRTRILADLHLARDEDTRLLSQPPVAEWLSLNKVE